MLLFRTITGSRLHGLSSDASDFDYLEVHTELFVTRHGVTKDLVHIINDEEDTIKVSLSHFLELASAGSHQMLDAMYSTIPEVDMITGLRQGFVGGSNIINRLRGTICELSVKEDLKKQRHAARITVNLEDYLTKGFYNPTLTEAQKEFILQVGAYPHEEFKRALHNFSTLRLGLKFFNIS